MRTLFLLCIIACASGVMAQGRAEVYSGSGSPEGIVTAQAGAVYIASDGTIYSKAKGSGSVGWVLLPSAGGVVSSVAGKTGVVTLACSDLTNASASCSVDATLVANVVGAAPLSSPALIGSPTTPNQTALSDNTLIANTHYADAAVAVETSRATTAEGTKANTSSLATVATSGSAADLTGTLNNARLPSAISVPGSVTGGSFVAAPAGGAGGEWICPEGTDTGHEATVTDLFWCSSSTHRAMLSNNNGTSGQLALSTDTLAFFLAGAIANGTTATTQSANSNDTKLATDAYADAVIAKPLFTGNSAVNTVHVGSSDFTSSASGQTAITGLSWTLPANTAANYKFDCTIWFNEATTATTLTWSVNDVTLAPTNMVGFAMQESSVNAANWRTFVGVSATGSQTLAANAPNAAATNLAILISGFVEQPSGAASVLQFEVGVGGGTNVLTVKRDSNCRLSQ